MIVNENECIVCSDVDDTLVIWDNKDFKTPGPGKIAFKDPYDNSINYLKVHWKHVDLLKKYKGRGFYIRVWSAAGGKWARSVVETLGMELFVDSVETKPMKYLDDITDDQRISRILGSRVYIPYEE